MIPRKAKDFIKPTAEELGYSESLVDDFVSFYWQEVRNKLSNPDSVKITIANLGTFNVMPWKVEGILLKYERVVKYASRDTFHEYASVKQTEKKKFVLEKLIKKLKEVEDKRVLVKKIKEEYHGKITNGNIHAQEGDPGRDNQRSIQEGTHREDSQREAEDL